MRVSILPPQVENLVNSILGQHSGLKVSRGRKVRLSPVAPCPCLSSGGTSLANEVHS